MSLLEHVQGSREALSALAQTPAQQRKPEEIRAFVAELMPVLRDVRGKGHGFRRIVKVLEEEKGVKIARTTLERHFKALEKQNPEPVRQVSTPRSIGPEVCEGALKEGSSYVLKSRENPEKPAKKAYYRGLAVDRHVFQFPNAEGTSYVEKLLSSDALRHYEIRACES